MLIDGRLIVLVVSILVTVGTNVAMLNP